MGILTLMVVMLPLLGAGLLAILPRRAEGAAYTLANTVLVSVLGVTLVLGWAFDPQVTEFQFVYTRAWLPEFGANWSLGVDGLSLVLVVLTSFLTLLVGVHAQTVNMMPRGYLIAVLLLEASVLGAFLAIDALAFYVFWESMLVPMFFLIGVWGSERRIYATMKFFIYTALGGLPLLAAIVYLGYAYFVQTNETSFLISDWQVLSLSWHEQVVLLAIFGLAFAIKIPAFPLHTWLPDAHVEAPAGGSVILAGVLLKLGIYGVIRFCLPLFSDAFLGYSWVLVLLAVAGIIYGALMAWVQEDMKKLIAYSSISHLGFCLLGVASLAVEGLSGAILQLVNHGITTGALFFVVSALYERYHTRLIADYGGLAGRLPRLSMLTLVFVLGAIGLPLTNGFVGEFLIILGGFRFSTTIGAVAVCGVVLGAVYLLSWYRRCFFGALGEKLAGGGEKDVGGREYLVFVPLAVLVFVLGVYPAVVLERVNPVSEKYLRMMVTAQPAVLEMGADGEAAMCKRGKDAAGGGDDN